MSPSLTPYADAGLLNLGDFIEYESILHPVAIGSIAIIFLFGWLRLSSNRTLAPLTIWDGICCVALGSTLASIINGQQLVRGLLALSMLLIWQYLTSWIGAMFPKLGILFTKPPMIVAFRGHMLEGIMKKHRITRIDLYGALRKAGMLNICEVECVVVEPQGTFSIFKVKDMPDEHEPEVLLAITGYRKLVQADDEEKARQKNEGMRSQETLHGSGACSGEDPHLKDKKKDKDEDGMTKEDTIAQKAA